MHMFHIWHIYVHTSPRNRHQVLGTYAQSDGQIFAIKIEVEVAGGLVLAYICKNVGSICSEFFTRYQGKALDALHTMATFSNYIKCLNANNVKT